MSRRNWSRRCRSSIRSARRPACCASVRPMLGTSKLGWFGSPVTRNGSYDGAEVGRPGDREVVVAIDRVDADVVGNAAIGIAAQVVGDAHQVGQDRLELVLRVGVAGEQLQRAGRMAAAGVGHRAQDGEPVGDLRQSRQQLADVNAGRWWRWAGTARGSRRERQAWDRRSPGGSPRRAARRGSRPSCRRPAARRPGPEADRAPRD